MTREELKETLKSPANKMAGEAIQLIKTGGPLTKLETLVGQGCPDTFYERDPRHPRSRFLPHKVIDTCFDSKLDIVSTSEAGADLMTATLGHVLQSTGREGYFKILLEAGFQPGSNGWRGELFPHILNSCFYYANNEEEKTQQAQAKIFAKVLVESGRFNLQNYANHNYHWIGNLASLEYILTLGADPTGAGMIDNALTYVGCSPNRGETHEDRCHVIRQLLKLGATPEKPLQGSDREMHDGTIQKNSGAKWDIRRILEKYQLVETLAPFGVITIEKPQAYIDFFGTQEKLAA